MSAPLRLLAILLVLGARDTASEIVSLGSLETLSHGVSGEVSVDTGKNVVIIERFSYDGRAPDATFWVGTSGRPREGGFDLYFPEGTEGTKMPLGRFKNVKVKMGLRDRFDVRDLKWISVWSESENGSLGELVLEDKIRLGNGGEAIECAASVAVLLIVNALMEFL